MVYWQLPVQALDGELWLARGKFDLLSGIVRKSEPQDDEWRQLKYMVFELPQAPGTFAERAQRIRSDHYLFMQDRPDRTNSH